VGGRFDSSHGSEQGGLSQDVIFEREGERERQILRWVAPRKIPKGGKVPLPTNTPHVKKGVRKIQKKTRGDGRRRGAQNEIYPLN